MMHLFTGKGFARLRQAVYARLPSRSTEATNEAAGVYVVIDSLDHFLQHASLAEASPCKRSWVHLAFMQPCLSHSTEHAALVHRW